MLLRRPSSAWSAELAVGFDDGNSKKVRPHRQTSDFPEEMPFSSTKVTLTDM
jgi:hypothetical protein